MKINLSIARRQLLTLAVLLYAVAPAWAVDENLKSPLTEPEVLQVLNFFEEFIDSLQRKDRQLSLTVEAFYLKENPRLHEAAIRFQAALIAANGGHEADVQDYLRNHGQDIPPPTEAEVELARKHGPRFAEIMNRWPA